MKRKSLIEARKDFIKNNTSKDPDFMESKEFIALYRDVGLVYKPSLLKYFRKYPTLCFKRKVGRSWRTTYHRDEAVRYIELITNSNDDFKKFDSLVKATRPNDVGIINWRMRVTNLARHRDVKIRTYKFYSFLFLTADDYDKLLDVVVDYKKKKNI